MQRPDAAPHPGPPPAGDGRPPESPAGWPPGRPAGVRLRPTVRELVASLAVLVGLAAVGLVVAPLWVWLAPRLEFRVVRPGLALPVLPEAEEYIAADGRFALLTLAAGVLAGLLCWTVRRVRGPLVLLALAAGGLAGAVVAWRVGLLLGPGYEPQDLQVVGRIVRQPLKLGARAALVVEPVAAVAVYLLGAGFCARNDLGRDDAGGAERPAEPGPGRYPPPGPDQLGRHAAASYAPDPYAPDSYAPDPHPPDPHGPDPRRPDPHRPDPYGPDPHRPDPYGPDPYGPDPPEGPAGSLSSGSG